MQYTWCSTDNDVVQKCVPKAVSLLVRFFWIHENAVLLSLIAIIFSFWQFLYCHILYLFYKENYFETYSLMLGSDKTGRASWNSPTQEDDILCIIIGPEKVKEKIVNSNDIDWMLHNLLK